MVLRKTVAVARIAEKHQRRLTQNHLYQIGIRPYTGPFLEATRVTTAKYVQDSRERGNERLPFIRTTGSEAGETCAVIVQLRK